MARRTLLVFLFSALWLALGLFRPLEVYDEGIALVGGMRILGGDVPYRDFYAIYTPGQYYLTAFAQWLLGSSVLSERLVSLCIRASIATLGFVLARRVASARWAWCGWALVLAWVSYFSFFSNSSFSGLVFSLAGIAAVTAQGPSRRRLLVGGGLCGFAFLFRQDFGVYACAGQLAVLACRALTDSASGRRVANAMADAALFGAGFLVVIALPVAYFVSELGAQRLYHTLFEWPFELTSVYRSLPWPLASAPDYMKTAERLQFLTVPLTYALVGLGVGWRLLRGPRDSRFWARLQLLLFGVFVLNQALRRSDLMHLAPSLVTSLILLPVLLEALVRALPPARLVRAAALVLVVAPLCWAPARTFVRDSLPALGRGKQHGIERARHIPLARDQELALQFIRERTGPDEAIYVGNWSHDVVIWNDIAFYFLADRPIPTPHYKFDPGYTTTEGVQREMIEDLERANVRWVVLYGLSRFVVEPNQSGVPESRLLDEYLAAHYELAATFGNYRILQLRLP